MHKRMLKDATLDDLAEFVDEFILALKSKNEELYQEAEDCLYKKIYGEHFTEWMLEKALKTLEKEPKWTVEETTEVARNNGISLVGDTNCYDWNYAMNSVYSMFHELVPDTISTYVRLAKRFSDKGKAFRIWKNLED